MDNGGPPHSQNLREKDSEKVPIFHWLTGAPVVFAASVIFEKRSSLQNHFGVFLRVQSHEKFSSSTKRLPGFGCFDGFPAENETFSSDFAKCSLEAVSGNLVPLIYPIGSIYHIYHLYTTYLGDVLLFFLDYSLHLFLNRLVYELHHFDQLSGAFIRMVFLGGWRKEPEIQRPKIKNLPLSPWEKGTKRKILPSKFVQKWQALSKSSYMFIWFFLQTPHHKKSWKYVHFVFLRTGAILQTYGLSHYHPSSCSTRPPHCGGS